MIGRWIRRVATVAVVVLTADAAFGAQTVPGWMMNIQPGSAVRVTMKTGDAFDAIWMGPDGERAVFERFDPHETISVSPDSVRRMRTRKGPSSSNAAYMAQLGIATGVFGVLTVIGLRLRGR
jgi:hypothetical protein